MHLRFALLLLSKENMFIVHLQDIWVKKKSASWM